MVFMIFSKQIKATAILIGLRALEGYLKGSGLVLNLIPGMGNVASYHWSLGKKLEMNRMKAEVLIQCCKVHLLYSQCIKKPQDEPIKRRN
jgi:hypothetical protein